ncbi:substrate-binding domain-containing protein [Halosolutus halophilus]|uniref:substrate-binding domain-containing protein n=1 Tax=Halosolutus halophilus TaxID=1552990 RepID=UPI00223514F6|nr:substrate-binding domain-containing protein [Halosolutus halophilus]
MQRRSLLKGIGGATATLGMAGCLGVFSGDDRGPVLWHDFADSEEEDLENYLGEFNDGRDTELEADAVSDLEQQLNTGIPAGEGPVSFAWAHDWVGAFEDKDFLYDGSDDIEVDLESTYTEAAAEAVSFDGGVYGLPYAAETVTLMYNAEMVDEPPETVDEMVDIMEEYHDPDQGRYGLSYPSTDPYFVSAWIHAFGGYYFDDETGELGLEDDATVEGLEYLADNFWPYVAADPGYESQTAVFSDGNAPFAIQGPWELGGFRDGGVDTEVAPLPTADGNDPSPYTGIQMWYFTSEVGDADENERAATADWAEWYTTNEDVILGSAESHGFIPVHQDYIGSDELGDDVETFAETVDMGIPMPTDPRMDQVWVPVEEALESVFNEEATAQDALANAAEQIRGNWD